MVDSIPKSFSTVKARDYFYREPFAFRSSTQAVARFPFPFSSQKSSQPYRYSVNIEPHVPSSSANDVTSHFFDIDEFYFRELQERQLALDDFPEHYVVPERCDPSARYLLNSSLRRLAGDYPNYFSYQDKQSSWHWKNYLTGEQQNLNLAIPMPSGFQPLRFLGQQLPGDWVLLEQKNNQLYLAGGLVTGAAGWSLAKNLGLNFLEWHRPVPDDHQVFARSLKYLLRLPEAQPVRRLNWGVCVQPRLDHSPENQPKWESAWSQLTDEEISSKVCLRVELQVLERLPVNNFIAFYIKTYFLSFGDIRQNTIRARQMAQVLEHLPANIAEYKNIANVIPRLVSFLTSPQ